MKKARILGIALAVFVMLAIIGICFKNNLFGTKIGDITSEKGYKIINQETFDFAISIPKALLPDTCYTSEGHSFEENEVIVYQNETSSVYLEKVMLANEGDDRLYFMFNYSYDLPDSGSLLLPYQKTDNGYTYVINLQSKDLADSTHTYQDVVGLRARGPSEQFAFYVSTDVCKKATGTMTIKALCNQLTFEGEKA